MKYTIFTDGASRGNPGRGGWSAIVLRGSGDDAHVTELGGYEAHTTNNRMELMAAIQGLSHTASTASVMLFTDSSYVMNGITKWIKGWRKNDWKTKLKEDVLNKDLWIRLSDEEAKRKVAWKYVGGHVGIAGNERCDTIATEMADGKEAFLYNGPLSSYLYPDILNIRVDEVKVKGKHTASDRSRTKAYSYISKIDGKIEIHSDWASCEKRVKGARGARFKKSTDPSDEKSIVEEFKSE